jgi:hypothetical protein
MNVIEKHEQAGRFKEQRPVFQLRSVQHVASTFFGRSRMRLHCALPLKSLSLSDAASDCESYVREVHESRGLHVRPIQCTQLPR